MMIGPGQESHAVLNFLTWPKLNPGKRSGKGTTAGAWQPRKCFMNTHGMQRLRRRTFSILQDLDTIRGET